MIDQEIVKLVQQVYDSFNAGDIDGVLGALADDIEWALPTIPNVSFFGPRKGRDNVTAFFSTMTEHQEPKSFDVNEIIAQGNRAVATGHYVWHVKATGRDFEGDYAHLFTVEEGKIVRFQECTDTAAIAAAYQP